MLVAFRGPLVVPTRWPLLGEGVAKQKCGSCQFFQEAGLAGSGWCHHPQRNVSSGVLIMVRRNELACRDEWSRSLWQPAAGPRANEDQPFQRSSTAGPLPPTPAENLRSLLGLDAASATPTEGEDVLLSEARIVSEGREPWDPSPRLFPAGSFDPRTAIFRAREAYRDRARAKAAAGRQSAAAEATGEEKSSLEESQADPGVSPSNLSDLDATTSLAGSTEIEESERMPGLSKLMVEPSTIAGPERNNESPSLAEHIEQHPESMSRLRSDESGAETHRIASSSSASMPGEQQDDAVGSGPPRERTLVTPPLQDKGEDETLPGWYRADLPRICRSCRDYRPSADGQRGWCANAWAFTHRRLVHEDDVAPCQSAIGDWWLPVDDVWLVAADVSSHGRATPLLDRLAGKIDPQRRRS